MKSQVLEELAPKHGRRSGKRISRLAFWNYFLQDAMTRSAPFSKSTRSPRRPVECSNSCKNSGSTSMTRARRPSSTQLPVFQLGSTMVWTLQLLCGAPPAEQLHADLGNDLLVEFSFA